LRRILFEGPEERLNGDVMAQLAVHTVCCATVAVLREKGILPDVVSGYSSGFYAALYAAGCFDFGASLLLVRNAGELLLQCGRQRPGAMGMVFGLPEAECCRRTLFRSRRCRGGHQQHAQPDHRVGCSWGR
jgi:malonyl CoA-acyl carrier protein transacylase